MLIRWCASQAGVPWDCYVVLGDDVVISDSKVAKLYKQSLDTLGVTISEGKSVTCERQVTGSAAEFAKCLFRDGQDLTPISPDLIKEIFNDHQWWKMIDLISEIQIRCKDHKIYITDDGTLSVPAPFIDLYNLLSVKDRERLKVLICDPHGPRCLITKVKEVVHEGPTYVTLGSNP
jgi:hypothetical protein